LTHAHPDHYLGFQVIQQAFPKVRFLTTPAVLDDFNHAAPPLFQTLKQYLGSKIADALVTPEAIDGGSIAVDGVQLDVIEMPNAGESAHAAALALRSQGTLFSGDLLYNDVHLVLGECHADGWKKNLDAVEAMGFTTFYPGHGGKIGAAAFTADATYIDSVIPILEANVPKQDSTTAESAIGAQFPAYESSFLLDYSTKQYFMNCK
jgi:glyoxylase-like metal-dependent hydrolase (beta-lactamase superfamily II)